MLLWKQYKIFQILQAKEIKAKFEIELSHYDKENYFKGLMLKANAYNDAYEIENGREDD